MQTSPLPVKQVYIIGAGGVASYLLPVLLKLFNAQEYKPRITVFDGDTLEEKNIDRQLFSAGYIGSNKAYALVDMYLGEYDNITSRSEYFVAGTDGIERNALYLVCVDNHTARKAVLETVDGYGGRVIIGANEYTDAEAYVYEPAWQGTPLDPRVYYKDIVTDETGDPTRPQSCQGHAALLTPQLVLANSSAANFMMWLVWFHYIERPKMDKDTRPFWPYLHRNNFSRFSTALMGQVESVAKPKTPVEPAATAK